MANHQNSGALSSGASYGVSNFASFSVYAANGSTVTTTASGKTGTYTIPASGVLTITDLADSVSVNAAFAVVGLTSTATM
jgi:hypothetical protein